MLEIVFPVTCVSCGCSTAQTKQFICDWCRHERFEQAGYEKGEILPEKVFHRFSLWHFDKGGYLQKMLHDLKYQHLKGVGEELGWFLGDTFLKQAPHGMLEKLDNGSPVLIPVPLHPSKRRKRGYNQARSVALGISRATGWELADRKTVIRVKKTKTQTGLSSEQRTKNLEGAFLVPEAEIFRGKIPVIIDDVFTTGATTFELADTIIGEENRKAVILTIAKA